MVWEAAYLPFGEAQILTETITNNIRFPGQYYDDETGELDDNEDSGHDHITRFNIIIPISDIKVYSLFSKEAFDAIESNTEL